MKVAGSQGAETVAFHPILRYTVCPATTTRAGKEETDGLPNGGCKNCIPIFKVIMENSINNQAWDGSGSQVVPIINGQILQETLLTCLMDKSIHHHEGRKY